MRGCARKYLNVCTGNIHKKCPRINRNANNYDLLAFARATKEKFTDLIGKEIKDLKCVKVSFG